MEATKAEGVVLDNLQDGVWEIKCADDDMDKGPRSYHLIHFRIKDVVKPQMDFPLRSCWKGAQFDETLVSKTDVICNVYCYGQLDHGQAAAGGYVQFGLDGPRCKFSEHFTTFAELSMGLHTVFAGLTLTQNFVDQWAPKALRLWLVSDSKLALKWLWRSNANNELTASTNDLINWTDRRFAIFPT